MSPIERPFRVVIADDHPQIRQMLSMLLSTDPNLEVVAQASNGDEAIAAACEHDPDLALVDLEMPEVDGFTVLSELHRRCPHVTTAVISGQPRELNEVRALDLGASLYLEKATAVGRELIDTLLDLLRPASTASVDA